MHRYKVILFGGTSEGRELSEYLSAQGIPSLVCVATSYGEELIREVPGMLDVRTGRLGLEEMSRLFMQEQPEVVVDATHPYASAVTQNIRKACGMADISYRRLLRPTQAGDIAKNAADGKNEAAIKERADGKREADRINKEDTISGADIINKINRISEVGSINKTDRINESDRISKADRMHAEHIIHAADIDTAAKILADTEGNILVTTGSKELKPLCTIPHYEERLFVRVLPVPDILEACHDRGIKGRHLIAMQGPFSEELNLALIREFDIRWLLTKESGRQGGFQEKINAARKADIRVLLIDRPVQESGYSLEEMKIQIGELVG